MTRPGRRVRVRFGGEVVEGVVVEVRDEPGGRRRVVVAPDGEDVELDVDERRVDVAGTDRCPACDANLADAPAYRCPDCGLDLVGRDR